MVAGSSGLRSVVPATAAFGLHVHSFFTVFLETGARHSSLQHTLPGAVATYTEVLSTGIWVRTGYYDLVRLFTKKSHSAPVGSVWEGQHCRSWGDGNRSTQKLAVVKDCAKRCLCSFRFWKALKTKSCGWEVPPGSSPRILSTGFPKVHMKMYYFLSSAHLSPNDWSYMRSHSSLFFSGLFTPANLRFLKPNLWKSSMTVPCAPEPTHC